MQSNPYAQQAPPTLIKICELRPSVEQKINTTFIVIEKGPITKTSESSPPIAQACVADQTACVLFQLWGSECEAFQAGDICRLTNGMFSYHKSELVLRKGRKGTLEKTGEFTMLFVEGPNMSRIQWVQDPNEPKQWMPASYQGSGGHHGYGVPAPGRPPH